MDVWPEEETLAGVFVSAKEPVKDKPQVEADVEYQTRPIEWIVERLGVPEAMLRWSLNDYGSYTWDGTVDPLVVIAEALADWKDAGVESGTGTGKSFLAACLILWFLACWKDARVFTFAPKEDQLRLFIWTEIGKLWPKFKKRFPTAELNDLRIRMVAGDDDEDAWGAVGYAVGVRAGEEVATKAAGMHAEHMLLVYEETPGIPLPVLVAGENTCTAPHNLRLGLGNPDSQHDTLHQLCISPGVVQVRISALDHPNVVLGTEMIPGAVGRKAVERRATKYGVDSRMYMTRVRGISPLESAEALIRWAWCEEAAGRYNNPAFRKGKRALGVDVANSEHGDEAAIARGVGACLLEVVSFQCPDSNILGVQVEAEMRADGVEAEHVGVDAVGVGAGTVNKLKELGRFVQALIGGPEFEIDDDLYHEKDIAVDEAERYISLRAQMWWQGRQDLQNGTIALPSDEELFRDLTTPTWRTRGGKIIVEAKEDLKKRLGRSPNKGDAFIYWNWVRRREPVPVEAVKPPANVYDNRFDELLAEMEENQQW